MKTLTIIIPCYNEEAVLSETNRRVLNVIDNLEGFDSNILYVNDGSKDKTGDLLRTFCEESPKVKAVMLSRNFGHQAALTAGLKECDADYIAVIDADLQDPPELIPEMLHLMITKDANVVFGVRKEREGEGWFKKFSAKWFYRFLNSMSDSPFPVDTGDFRIIDRKVLNTFNQLPEHNKYIRGLISWIGFKQLPFYYVRQERLAGETKYSMKNMINLADNALHYFSVKPLKIASSLGLLSVIIGLIMAIWTFGGKIFGYTHPESGWTSIIIIIIFFGGVQLLTIGLLGKYVGVIFDEVKRRPEYIIAEIVGDSDTENNKELP